MTHGIGFSAAQAVFLVHPGDHPDGATRMQSQLPNEVDRFHRDRDPGAVVDRACPQVPRIEVAGDDHDLLRDVRFP